MKLIKKVVSVVVSGAAAFTLMGNTAAFLPDTAFDNTVSAADSMEKETFKLNGALDRGRSVYDGSAYIWGINKTGYTGDIIEVPVYMKLGANVQHITGIAFKVEYDHDALELVDINEPYDSGFSDGGLNCDPNTGVYLYTYTIANITVDPKYPIVSLFFKVKADNGTYKIHLANHLFEGSALQLIHRQDRDTGITYLKPYTKDIRVTAKPADKKLGKITSVNADNSGKVTWDNADNAAYYRVVRITDEKTVYSKPIRDTEYNLVYVPKTDYRVMVAAYADDGSETLSPTVEVKKVS